MPPDLDLDLVRSFVVVAEQQNLGRAAATRHLTSSSLSRQISRLEQQVGARLLNRSPRGTTLTQAGQVFLPLAQALLQSAAEACARARTAAEPNRITIGYTVNIVITPAVRALRRLYPDADVRTLYLEWNESRTALLEHRVDATVSRLPFATDLLTVTVLYDEPRVLLVPREHRLAGRESVTIADIADEPVPRAIDPAWNAFWRIDPRPDGSRAPDGPFIDTVEDMVELVASGRAVAILPASVPVSSVRPDLTTIPLLGVEPGHVVLATRRGQYNPLAKAFGDCARNNLAGPAFRNPA